MATMKLFYVPFTRSTRARWMLEELGQPYELVKLDPSKGDTKSENYLKHHPLGHVPAFVDGDKTIIESAAICMYLADKFPEARLAPAVGTPERGEYYQWIIYGMATLEPVVGTIGSARMGKRVELAEIDAAKKRLHDVAKVIDNRLAGRTFIAADHFTAADVVIGAILAWANLMHLLHDFPRLQAYVARVTSRPAYARSRA